MKVWACILYVGFLVHFSSNSGSLGFMKVLVLNVRNLKQQEALFFPHGWSKGCISRSSLLTATESAGHTVGFVTPDAQLQQSRRRGVEGLVRRGGVCSPSAPGLCARHCAGLRPPDPFAQAHN